MQRGHQEPFVARESLNSAGNGALMRLAPLVIAYCNQPDKALELATDHARLTHSDPRCLDANRAWAWFMLKALEQNLKEDVLNPEAAMSALNSLHREIEAVVRGSYRTSNPPEIQGSGYVVKTMEPALWAFWHSEIFKEGLLIAVTWGTTPIPPGWCMDSWRVLTMSLKACRKNGGRGFMSPQSSLTWMSDCG